MAEQPRSGVRTEPDIWTRTNTDNYQMLKFVHPWTESLKYGLTEVPNGSLQADYMLGSNMLVFAPFCVPFCNTLKAGMKRCQKHVQKLPQFGSIEHLRGSHLQHDIFQHLEECNLSRTSQFPELNQEGWNFALLLIVKRINFQKCLRLWIVVHLWLLSFEKNLHEYAFTWFYVMTFNTCSHLSIERNISLTF